MLSPFRGRRLRKRFARDVLELHLGWDDALAATPEIAEPNVVVLRSASAAATVALGNFGTLLIDGFHQTSATLDLPDGEVVDRVVEFAHALQERPAADAAYRVATWTYVAELGAFFWRPNYELELRECAEAFALRNEYEGEVAALGEPVREDATVEEQSSRDYALQKAALKCMVGAATGVSVDLEDDAFVGMHIQNWQACFYEGLAVAKERVEQLAPGGLPIWEG
jgi:hypothetical protein